MSGAAYPGAMVFFRRRPRPQLPDDVAQALDVTGERVLAWSEVTGGGYAVATPEGLRVITPRGEAVRRPWTDVDHAAWQAESGALAIWWVGSRQTTPLEILDHSELPDVVHQRVTDSVLLGGEVEVPGGRVRIALRKAADGAFVTQAVPGPGVDVRAADVAPLVARALRDLREQVGLDQGAGAPSGL